MDLSAELIRMRAEFDLVRRRNLVKAMLAAELIKNPDQVDSCLTALALEEDHEVITLLKGLVGKIAEYAEQSHVERVLDAWRVEKDGRLLGRWSCLLTARPDLGSPQGLLCLIEAAMDPTSSIVGLMLSPAMMAWTEHSSKASRRLFCEWAAGPGKIIKSTILDAWSEWMKSAGELEVEILLEGIYWNLHDSRRGRCAILLAHTAHTRTRGVFGKLLTAHEEECSEELADKNSANPRKLSSDESIRRSLARAMRSWVFQAQREDVARLAALLELETEPYVRVELSSIISQLSHWGSPDLLQWYLVDLVKPMAEGYDHDPLAWRVTNYKPWLKWATQETIEWTSRQRQEQKDPIARWVMGNFLELCRQEAPHLFSDYKSEPY